MIRQATISVVAILALAGCRDIEGEFSPACIAFEGSTVLFGDGIFEWDRFTDSIDVDANGRPIDPFPGYPIRGSYTVGGNQVTFAVEGDQSLDPMYLLTVDGRTYLLTSAELATTESQGEVPSCALALNEFGDDGA